MAKKGKWDHHIKQMPLYDQGQVGICYAYSAIQLLGHWPEINNIVLVKPCGEEIFL